jgi:hypothetical protein
MLQCDKNQNENCNRDFLVNSAFDIDKTLCYHMINGKAQIEKSTDTVVDSSPSPGLNGNEPSYGVPLGLS